MISQRDITLFIKEYYDVESFLEILKETFKINFSRHDLQEWLEKDLICPHYKLKGLGALSMFNDKGDLLILAKGYCYLYLSDKATSLDLIHRNFGQKNPLISSPLQGLTKVENVTSIRFTNPDTNIDIVLDEIEKQSEQKGNFYFLTRFGLLNKLYNKYEILSTDFEDEGENALNGYEYSMDYDETVTYLEYFNLEISPPDRKFLDFEKPKIFEFEESYKKHNKDVTLDDMLIPEIQIKNLISHFQKIINNNDKTIQSTNDQGQMHPRTANNVSKIIGALCEMNKIDITKPYGAANQLIMAELQRLGCSLSKDVVGEWLKLAHENIK